MGKGVRQYTEKQWTFNDGKRTIDYVLVWNMASRKATSTRSFERRKTFEANLNEEGLELEHETVKDSELEFVKIHAPLDTLKRYAEILKLIMPMKEAFNKRLEDLKKKHNHCKSCIDFFKFFEVNRNIFPESGQELATTYERARDYLFDAEAPGFFTPAQKARVCQFILDRTLYNKGAKSGVFEFGISRLVMNGVYAAAYPLHDGDVTTPGSMRYEFYHHWASFRKWYKHQPDECIRQYFGVRTGLYFMWLGYYTRMLFPAAVVGLVCFIISLVLLPDAGIVHDVCDGKITDVMCPLCDRNCNVFKLTDYCFRFEILYVFDNITTVFFAIIMSFWAAIFLECWKRYSSEITFRWDLTSLDEKEENPRPEYAAKLSKMVADKKISNKLNFITNAMEPKMSFWKHVFPGKVLSLTTMLLLITLIIASLIGVTLYRIFTLSIVPFGFLSSVSASILNLICVLIFSHIYSKLAFVLTNMEMPRTQREFDNSITVKVYLLEFINNYSSIFYVAFIKGKFVGPPSGYYKLFGLRNIECGPGGCMMELTQQLAVIMIGKRAFRSIVQLLHPLITFKLRKRYSRNEDNKTTQWEKDYLLTDGGPRMLVPNYVDMVLQYGFVTIFVSAFPLAPLFALINNIFEIRIDARKFLIYNRRPTMRRVKDIGVWFGILSFVSDLSIFTNGIIIAFTSNFIPTLVYRLTTSKSDRLDGFLNDTLSYVAIKDLDIYEKLNTTYEYCRFADYREPPWSEHKYEETKMFWIVLAARFGFFILFENIIVAVVIAIKWLIPDIPQNVLWQLRRRHFVINEIIISHEAVHKTTSLIGMDDKPESKSDEK